MLAKAQPDKPLPIRMHQLHRQHQQIRKDLYKCYNQHLR